MKSLRNKMILHKKERSRSFFFLFQPALVSSFLCLVSIISCAADDSSALLNDLKAGRYDFFLKSGNAAYRTVKKMGHGSAYYVGLHLAQAGYGNEARFYFALGEKFYEAPYNRLCREALYTAGDTEARLQSVQKRLQELRTRSSAGSNRGAENNGTNKNAQTDQEARTERERLTALELQLLLQLGRYDAVSEDPAALYLSGTLTPELVEAFPQFGNRMEPAARQLSECRVLVYEKRYAEAWGAAQAAFGKAYSRATAYPPTVLSDVGKAGVYGADDPAAAAAFFEDLAAKTREAAAAGWLGRGDAQPVLFYALFYAARCRVKRGTAEQRERAAELFRQAAEQANSAADVDSALWYYLDTLRMLSSARYIRALTETVSQWKNPAWYADLVRSLRAKLVAAKDWKNLQTLYIVLTQTDLPEQRAAAAYALARSGSLPQDQAARLLQEAAGGSHNSLYYRLLSAHRIGDSDLTELLSLPKVRAGKSNAAKPHTADRSNQKRTSGQANTAGRAQTTGFSVQDARSYIDGLLHFGLYGQVYPQMTAVYPSVTAEDAVRIAEQLYAVGRYADAIRVVSFSLQNQEDNASEAQLRMLYPRPWQELVAKYAAEYRLPEYLLYALIRSESFFQPHIVSAAGAVGLTQLMPSTAADIAKKLKATDYSLTDPEINIKFGAYYLAEMIRRSDNRIMPACFAYNAGISRVRSWQRQAQGLSEDIFLESLEYEETREYGRKILSAAAVYGALYYSEAPEDIVRLFFPHF